MLNQTYWAFFFRIIVIAAPFYLNMSFEDITNRDTKHMSALTLNPENLVVDFSRFYILTILYEDPQHGYSILSTYKKRTGKVISPSLVIHSFVNLKRKGMLLIH